MPSHLATLALAVVGISFLIFFHELGHFVAARAFGVRVETFSLGFGRRLFGWRRGDTDYRISLIPLGGYVKMAGEYGDDPASRGTGDDELFGKPAWQRAVIFSGGVFANFVLAFALFPIAFHLGVPFTAPVLGDVVEGGPAWQAGLRAGDRVQAVDGQRVYDFTDIAHEVALGDPDGVSVRVERPGEPEPFDVWLVPARNDELGMYDAGVLPATTRVAHVVEGGPAEQAGLRTGDRLDAVDGVDWDDWLDGYAFDDAAPITVAYERDGVRGEVVVVPRIQQDPDVRLMGVTFCTTRVGGLRGAADRELALRVGDVVLAVDGQRVTTAGEVRERVAAAAGDALLRVRRGKSEVDVAIPDARRAWLRDDVGFVPDLASTRVRVIPRGALADAGLRDGITILAIDGERLTDYKSLQDAAGAADGRRLEVRYRTDEREATLTIETQPLETADIGFGVRPLTETHQESGMAALRAGYDVSINFLRTTWLTLTKLFTGDVSTKNLGGIVSIGVITYHFAEWGLARLLFFLGLLSINLGFINLLPIPALDGGQLVFVLLEKIKGSRLSDRFLNGAQLTGFLLLIALIVYVTYNDIVRISG